MLTMTPKVSADLDKLLAQAASLDASDIFVRPGRSPAARASGRVAPVDLPELSGEDVLALLREIASSALQERYERDGDVDVGYTTSGGNRFRLNFHRQMGRPALAVRTLLSQELELADLNLPQALEAFAELKRGLVLITGAAGSGKSTTLATLVHHINTRREAHILTVEDPVEFVHRDLKGIVSQREIGTDAATFGRALRHVIRESPDVIVIGELRDAESAEAAIQAALTGHLVLTTLHTIDAARGLQRLLAFFPEKGREALCADLSTCLKGIASLRLVQRKDGQGRVPAVEMLTVTPGVQRLIRLQQFEEIIDFMRTSEDPATRTFDRAIFELHQAGEISLEEAVANSSNPDELRLAIAGMHTGVTGLQEALLELGDVGLRTDMKALLALAVERGASDVHLSVGHPPTLRIHGELESLPMAPLSSADVRWILFSILSSHQRSTFEIEKELDLSLTVADQRFRVNAYHQKGHVAVALRVIPTRIPTPEDLELPAPLVELTERTQGLILMVGPTGSGKTTTTASLVDHINQQRACHVITVEDPIEYQIPNRKAVIEQREVYSDTRSFARALKYALRQDPDVIVVGEMRDLETISAALTAAETGHLVFATLHTNDAGQTIDRIVDAYPAHQQPQIRLQLAGSLLAIVSQRLLRRADGGGRLGVFELLLCNPAVRALIREGKTHQIPNVLATSTSHGMISMDNSLLNRYHEGAITHEEALRYMTESCRLSEASHAAESARMGHFPG